MRQAADDGIDDLLGIFGIERRQHSLRVQNGPGRTRFRNGRMPELGIDDGRRHGPRVGFIDAHLQVRRILCRVGIESRPTPHPKIVHQPVWRLEEGRQGLFICAIQIDPAPNRPKRPGRIPEASTFSKSHRLSSLRRLILAVTNPPAAGAWVEVLYSNSDFP